MPLRVGAPVLGEAHCQAVWGFSTRLQPIDHETTAIATNVPSGVRPFDTLLPEAVAGDPVSTFLRREFEKAEAFEIRAKRPDAEAVLAHRPDRNPILQVSCVSTGGEGNKLCSFQASRPLGTHPYKELPDCEEITVVQGWFLESPETLTLLRSAATLTDCDWKEVRTAAPMLLITAGKKRFVVVREHGYEDESFIVYEVRNKQLERVLEVAGGGC